MGTPVAVGSGVLEGVNANAVAVSDLAPCVRNASTVCVIPRLGVSVGFGVLLGGSVPVGKGVGVSVGIGVLEGGINWVGVEGNVTVGPPGV